ncbi:MAG TPA: hypothetical protein VK654_01815 [Nitrospirota bacterium]|nr:hypothetical protein [Nitrospirota bacterium]
MKKIAIAVVFVASLVAVLTGRAAAYSFYAQNEFFTAEALDPGMTQTGISFSLGDHYKSYYPDVRYGLGALMEVGVRFGATSATVNAQDKLGALIGADLKYQLIKEAQGIPLDLAVDLGLNNTIVNSKNASELTFSTIVSKSFPLTDRGYKFVPYGGLAMSALYGSLPAKDDTYVNAFGGIEWKVSQKFMILLEFKGGKSAVGGASIRFEY